MSPDLYRYLRLPVNADDGFPQAFRLALGAATYTVALTVTVVEEFLLGEGQPLRLPMPGAFLVLTMTREAPGPAEVVFRRKLVPGIEYEAAELALVAREMVVDPRNLGASGAFGSRVVAGVAVRWAS
jgi:hypothetical protein